MEKQEYLRWKKHCCPSCTNWEVETGNVEFKENQEVWIEKWCDECQEHWYDIYELKDMEEI